MVVSFATVFHFRFALGPMWKLLLPTNGPEVYLGRQEFRP
jgi:hypothetical protein